MMVGHGLHYIFPSHQKKKINEEEKKKKGKKKELELQQHQPLKEK